jgi:hypothetical protein
VKASKDSFVIALKQQFEQILADIYELERRGRQQIRH